MKSLIIFQYVVWILNGKELPKLTYHSSKSVISSKSSKDCIMMDEPVPNPLDFMMEFPKILPHQPIYINPRVVTDVDP
jgi:hypothetical protein